MRLLQAIYGNREAFHRFVLIDGEQTSMHEAEAEIGSHKVLDIGAVDACFELLNFLGITAGCQHFVTEV